MNVDELKEALKDPDMAEGALALLDIQHKDKWNKAFAGVKAVEGTFEEPECPDGCGASQKAHCWNTSDPAKCIYCGVPDCTRMTYHGIEDAKGNEIPQPMCEKCYQGEGP